VDEFEFASELGVLLEDELFMSVPCEAGELVLSVVWPLELVELPMLPLELPLTEPLPVCELSTGPIEPAEPVVPLEVSELVEGAAGRT
jgi:hypothetical protein